MTRRTALVAAVAVAAALWLGAASPALAGASEAPAPPAIGALSGCAAAGTGRHPSVGSCPALLRSSSSAVVAGAARRLLAGTTGAVAALLTVAASALVALAAPRRPTRPALRRDGARAPPPLVT